MADMGWASLTVWPWNDAWLAADEGLREAFEAAELSESEDGLPVLVGGMNGSRTDSEGRVVLEGEFRGGSYELHETMLLETLRDRRIAYHLVGDAKYEWDGDEEFWHPGMREPFGSLAGESGRFLDRQTFELMRLRAAPLDERLAASMTHIARTRDHLKTLRKARKDAPSPEAYDASIAAWEQTVRRARREFDRLRRDRPDPESLEALVLAHFEASPEWKPGPRYRPRLRLEPVLA